jgi:peptidyl-prolyl isomerase D
LSEEAGAKDGDIYADYPQDEDRDVDEPAIALEIASAVKEVGTKLFKEGRTNEALEKFQSELFSYIVATFSGISL